MEVAVIFVLASCQTRRVLLPPVDVQLGMCCRKMERHVKQVRNGPRAVRI